MCESTYKFRSNKIIIDLYTITNDNNVSTNDHNVITNGHNAITNDHGAITNGRKVVIELSQMVTIDITITGHKFQMWQIDDSLDGK